MLMLTISSTVFAVLALFVFIRSTGFYACHSVFSTSTVSLVCPSDWNAINYASQYANDANRANYHALVFGKAVSSGQPSVS